MCLVQQGRILEIKGKKALVLIKGEKKEVRIEDNFKKGDTIQVFQNLGFK